MDILLIATVVLLVVLIWLLIPRLDRIEEKLDRTRSDVLALDRAIKFIYAIDDRLSDIESAVELSLPQRARDRLAFRNAKTFTVADVLTWTPGSVKRVVEADWDPDHDDPMISRYEFRFLKVAEQSEGELGHLVEGEWRFSGTDEWKPHSFHATSTSAEVRLL